MMKKKILYLIPVIFFISICLIFIGIKSQSYNTKSLIDTLQIQPDEVTEIKISNFFGEYRSTTDKDKIADLMNYLESVHYKRLVNDQSTYMPMRARIIYLYDDKQSDFIVPYKTEAMINHRVYKIMDGEIEENYLTNYYETIDLAE